MKMADREKLIKLLCEANSKSVDAELFEDSSYAQQLEIEADFLIANGVTFAKDNNVLTNGDRIRAMTDEELAVLLMCPYGSEPDMCYTPGTCLYCCEEWLKQEAK